MHVSPQDFRAVRNGPMVVRLADLGPVAYVIAEFPSGTAETRVEDWCVRAHWGLVIGGSVDVERGDARNAIGDGNLFHVPPGPPAHRFVATDPVRLAGFEPLDAERRVDDRSLRRLGFEPIALPGEPGTAARAFRRAAPKRGAVDARVTRMGSLALSIIRFGPLSGYTSGWCDLPHWGLVLDGGLAIEWEDSVEVLSAGDAFRCQPGPPGHRMHAADPAVVLDFTPLDAVTPDARLVDWRREMLGLRRHRLRRARVVETVPIG